MQIRPLSADKLLSAESASNTEDGQQPSETIQMISIGEEKRHAVMVLTMMVILW
jgi:hypothetical protein